MPVASGFSGGVSNDKDEGNRVIQVSGLTKYFGEHRAVDQVDFAIERGQVVGFLGLNGAGKTTILRMLAGDLEPSAGSIIVDGRDLLDHPQEYRRRVGFLPETVPVYPDMTVREYLHYVGALRGMGGGELASRVEQVAARVAVADHLDVPIDNLSHGYTKRVGIASVIVHDPDLVILDEAISGLDPRQIVDMRSLIAGLAGDHTVLVSSHILPEISQTCDEILVIRDGGLAARGTEAELMARFVQGAVATMQVRGDKDAVQTALATVEGTKVTFGEDGEEVLEVRIESERDLREELVAACVKAGIGVRKIDMAQGELEAAFLQLSKGAA
jgi:ABC-2 type transport system ATP-binding protein